MLTWLLPHDCRIPQTVCPGEPHQIMVSSVSRKVHRGEYSSFAVICTRSMLSTL